MLFVNYPLVGKKHIVFLLPSNLLKGKVVDAVCLFTGTSLEFPRNQMEAKIKIAC